MRRPGAAAPDAPARPARPPVPARELVARELGDGPLVALNLRRRARLAGCAEEDLADAFRALGVVEYRSVGGLLCCCLPRDVPEGLAPGTTDRPAPGN